tara:strand:- start:3233 stop:4906 length:1674 start_codon:yes stop_codon:yes gene_type:complete
MLSRLFIVLGFSFCFSQDSISIQNINLEYQNLKRDIYHFDFNNLGDPQLLLTLFNDDKNLSLSHYSYINRNANNGIRRQYVPLDSIYSHIFYKSAYNSGGTIETVLKRPIGQYMKLDFLYHNLSSEGFYSNQENKSSSLFFSINYFNNKKPYSYSLSFYSNNGFYKQNGGSIYDSSQDSELMLSYMSSAETTIRNRELNLVQQYSLTQNLELTHNFTYNFFNRNFNDLNPQSFYYSMTPLFFLIESDYSLNSFYYRAFNAFSISNKKINFTINHNYYNTEVFKSNNFGDFDILLSRSQLDGEINNFNFLFNFCPIGYNKNSYLIDLSFNQKWNYFDNKLVLNIKSKKPHFFTRHYNTSYSFELNDFSPITNSSLSYELKNSSRLVSFSSILHYYKNYLYFNSLASPVQEVNSILYFNFILNKQWNLKNFMFRSNMCLQKSNNVAISLPSFLINQEIQYRKVISNNLKLYSSINLGVFSKYYVNSFFPLTDVFYNQLEEKKGLIPLISLECTLYRDNFYIGLNFKNLNNLFFEGQSLVMNYPISPQFVQLCIKWNFFD